MRLVGCSTGALALGEFRRGLEILHKHHVRAVELSVLRETELPPLLSFLSSPDSESVLREFSFISFHAPKRFREIPETQLAAQLRPIADRGWPIILHPDAIGDFACWQEFGELLCIENMGLRRRTGRTVDELQPLFRQLPKASFCLDVGHARQVDRTMSQAVDLLCRFGDRLKVLHVSDVLANGTHQPLTRMAMMSYAEIAPWIPSEVPVILESPVTAAMIENEVVRATETFSRSEPTKRTA